MAKIIETALVLGMLLTALGARAAAGTTVLEITTDHPLAYQRLGFRFALLDGPAQNRKVE